jgi:hypothetical protein
MKIATNPDIEVEWDGDAVWPVKISVAKEGGLLTRAEAHGLASWILGALAATEKEED